MKMLRSRSDLALLVVLLLPLAALAAGAAGAADTPQRPMGSGPHGHGAMNPADCPMHQALQAEAEAPLQSMDEKLQALLANAEAATGEARVDALVAVVKEMAAQRTQMRQMMMARGGGMGMQGMKGGCCGGHGDGPHGMGPGAMGKGAGGCCAGNCPNRAEAAAAEPGKE